MQDVHIRIHASAHSPINVGMYVHTHAHMITYVLIDISSLAGIAMRRKDDIYVNCDQTGAFGSSFSEAESIFIRTAAAPDP